MAALASKKLGMALIVVGIVSTLPVPTAVSVAVQPFGPIPGPSPQQPGTGAERQQCWSSLVIIPGCVTDVVHVSVSRGQVRNISPACCDAAKQISEQCWLKMFPLHPFWPQLLESSCGGIAYAPAGFAR